MKRFLLATLFLLVVSAPGASLRAQTVNGCSLATAESRLHDTAVTINFPNGNFTYVPDCIVIHSGTQLTFSGSFLSHPLRGGTFPTVDPGSPIPSVSSGSTSTFSLDEPGIYGYFCDNHGSTMDGAIIVALFADGFETEDPCEWTVAVPSPGC